MVDPLKKAKAPLFDHARMAAALTSITRQPYDAQHLPFSNLEFAKNDGLRVRRLGTARRRHRHHEEEDRGGNPWRSKWYHNYGYGNLRDYGLADKKAAIEQLAVNFQLHNSATPQSTSNSQLPSRSTWELGLGNQLGVAEL